MTDANRAMLEAVVDEIGDLRNDVVFVGGAVAGLLITNPGGDPIRETDDVDCIVELGSSVLSYHQIESRLHASAWKPGAQTVAGDPLCRFRKGSLILDVMPTAPEVLGFAAQWAREAISHSTLHKVGQGKIKVVSAPYFLAMKIEAFNGRGKNDYYGSHDLEDLVVVVEGRHEIVGEVRHNTTSDLQIFLADQLELMWPRLLAEAIPGAMRGNTARIRLVEERFAAIRKIQQPEHDEVGL